MKKYSFLFLCIFFYVLTASAFGIESFHHAQCILSKNVTGSRCHRKLSTQNVTTPKKDPSSPKIHQGLWPCFCPHHLIENPEECSSWSYDRKGGKLQLELIIEGNAAAYYDPELIRRVLPYIDLIPKNSAWPGCEYAWCPTCQQPVLMCLGYNDDYEDEDESEQDSREWIGYTVLRKCGCLSYWLGDWSVERPTFKGWQFCKAPTIYSGYVDWHHSTYFRFLERHLAYVSENPACECYWPQVNETAKALSDGIYARLLQELENSSFGRLRDPFCPPLAKKSRHGFLSGLLSHAFFYSDYHTVLADIDQYCFKEITHEYPSLHARLIQHEEEMQAPFLSLYTQCLEKHPHPKIYYERGMVLFHRGENLDSLEDIRTFMSYAKSHNYEELLTSDLYLE